MKKVFNFKQQIKHFSEMFDKRTYQTFQAVVDGIAKMKDWTQDEHRSIRSSFRGLVARRSP